MKQILVAEATLTSRVAEAIGSLPIQYGLTAGTPDLVILDAQGPVRPDLPPSTADAYVLVLDGPLPPGLARASSMAVLEFDPALTTTRSLISPFAADFTHGLIATAGDVPLTRQKELQSSVFTALGFSHADVEPSATSPISSIQTSWGTDPTGRILSIATEREGGLDVEVRLSGLARAVDLHTGHLGVLPWSIRIADSSGEHTYPPVHETAVRAVLREFASAWRAGR